MSILVTGGAGYIGSHMVAGLVDLGRQVVVLDNLSTGFEWAVTPPAKLVVGDVGDHSLVVDLIKSENIDAVIHFAGSIIVPESVSDPLKYYLNNTARTRTLIDACVVGNVRSFIFSSTAAVYGEPDVSPVVEDYVLDPISPYGRSKLMTEWMLADVALAHDFNYVALRYFNVSGADPKGRVGQSTPNATHLIKVASEAALGKRAGLEIFGRDYDTPDGTCVRDYIHVTDLAQAHLKALEYLGGGGRSDIFNCGYGKGFSVLDVIAAVERVSGKTLKVLDAPRRAGDPPALVSCADKALDILGWVPEHDDLDKIVGSALAWEEALAVRRGAA